MKNYKTIIRIDYPLNYGLLDNLGQQLEFVHQKTLNDKDYTNSQGNVDFTKHSIAQIGNCKKDSYSLNLSLKTIDITINYNNGIELDNLINGKLFKLYGEMLKKISVTMFDRIGMRFWIVLENKKFQFENIKNYITKSTSLFSDVFTEQFSGISDVGLVYETFSDHQNSRVSLGPYKAEEAAKYQFLNPEVKEGLILDIDIWESKLKTPEYNIKSNLISRLEMIKKIMSAVEEKMKGVLP
jgi:hypothetical protein